MGLSLSLLFAYAGPVLPIFAALLFGAVNAVTVVWDGRFNHLTSSTDLNNWSWANQVGPYQYYIHGSDLVTQYVNLSPSYKNPADTVSRQGVKITIDPTALWNSDMWRTELISQTSANFGTGRLYYHFSMKKTSTNPPHPGDEHQVNFFESHFTEMKYGWINGNPTTAPDNNLRWFNVDWVPDVWHNFAYDIDFSARTVALWHSAGSNPLTQVVGPISASTFIYFSGVYVESGSSPPTSGTAAPTPRTISTRTSTPVNTTSDPSATPTVVVQKWGQCGGIGWTGPTACVSRSTCTKINDW
ncbi:hypothetical protein BDZ91DRAFT_775442 [Kalaharituber pfeilii]|nr:hypothetical protein BDZ91DRAFT_775442 [Kalaharituber pfeilii]